MNTERYVNSCLIKTRHESYGQGVEHLSVFLYTTTIRVTGRRDRADGFHRKIVLPLLHPSVVLRGCSLHVLQ